MGQAQHFRPIISFNSSPQSSDVVSVAIIIIIFHFTDKDIEVEKQRLGIYPNLTARGWSFAQSLLAKSLGITPKVRVPLYSFTHAYQYSQYPSGYLFKRTEIRMLERDLHSHIHCSIILSSGNRETT